MSYLTPPVWYGAHRLVHLGVNPRGAIPPGAMQALEAYLTGLQGDWYRYASQNYVVWTNKELDLLAREIVAIPLLSQYFVFATVFHPNMPTCNGWLPQQFWDWLQKYP
jgi:hypothetical protein